MIGGVKLCYEVPSLFPFPPLPLPFFYLPHLCLPLLPFLAINGSAVCYLLIFCLMTGLKAMGSRPTPGHYAPDPQTTFFSLKLLSLRYSARDGRLTHSLGLVSYVKSFSYVKSHRFLCKGHMTGKVCKKVRMREQKDLVIKACASFKERNSSGKYTEPQSLEVAATLTHFCHISVLFIEGNRDQESGTDTPKAMQSVWAELPVLALFTLLHRLIRTDNRSMHCLFKEEPGLG
jgi:hypothetical protein